MPYLSEQEPRQIGYIADTNRLWSCYHGSNEIGGIAGAESLFRHAIAAMHAPAPAYREENAGVLR